MRSDFCAMILTHGRPDRVHTYGQLRASGYTGLIRLVVDDKDAALGEYRSRYGDEVLVFSKDEVAARVDEGSNLGERRSPLYARNACFDLARDAGCRYFVQLDDDYTSFFYRWGTSRVYGQWRVRTTMDACFSAILDYLIATPAIAVAMSQGGDHIGGRGDARRGRDIRSTRKAMNSFFCSVDRPFSFFGVFNDDVNTYVLRSLRGELMLTIPSVQLNQLRTQSNPGGITEAYLSAGTYVKSSYTVLYAPACARVSVVSDPRSPHSRVHHVVDWGRTAPKILNESWRKP